MCMFVMLLALIDPSQKIYAWELLLLLVVVVPIVHSSRLNEIDTVTTTIGIGICKNVHHLIELLQAC